MWSIFLTLQPECQKRHLLRKSCWRWHPWHNSCPCLGAPDVVLNSPRTTPPHQLANQGPALPELKMFFVVVVTFVCLYVKFGWPLNLGEQN